MCPNNNEEFACVHPDGVRIWNIKSGINRESEMVLKNESWWGIRSPGVLRHLSIADFDGIVLYEGENTHQFEGSNVSMNQRLLPGIRTAYILQRGFFKESPLSMQ